MAKKSEKESSLSIEESIEKLEDILEKMEERDVELDVAFGLYEEGIKLLKETNSKIDMVEKKVLALSDDGTIDEFEEE